VWLRQRGLAGAPDGAGGFFLSMLLALLFQVSSNRVPRIRGCEGSHEQEKRSQSTGSTNTGQEETPRGCLTARGISTSHPKWTVYPCSKMMISLSD
jgi:hypothetical protein